MVERKKILADKRLQIEAKRPDICGDLLGAFFEGHEDAGLVVLRGSPNEKLGGEKCLATARPAAHDRWPAAWETAKGDFIQPGYASGRFGNPRVIGAGHR